MNDTDQLMEKLVNAVSFTFKSDKTSPGITVSKLKKGYYCSVIRYEGAFARDKVVFCKSRGETLFGALNSLAKQFVDVAAPVKDPVQELNDFIK